MPDLAFNEMFFLNSRRAKPEEPAGPVNSIPSTKTTRRKSTKAADTEAEISRYFTSAKATAQNASDRQANGKETKSQRKTQNHESLPAFVDLPDNPFLGFGSCGANSASPVKRLDSGRLRDLERRLTRSPTRSTSYFTWSQSVAPLDPSPHRDKQTSNPLESSKYANRRRHPSMSIEAAAPKVSVSSPGASNIPITKYGATTRSSPPSDRSENTSNGLELLSRREKRPRSALSSSQMREEPLETQPDPEGMLLQSVETITTNHGNEPRSRRIAKPGSRKQTSRDSTEIFARAKRRQRLHENDIHKVKICTGHMLMEESNVDPPDTTIDDLLQDCKFQGNAEAVSFRPDNLEQFNSRLNGQPSTGQCARNPRAGSQEDERYPQRDPMLDVKLPATGPMPHSERIGSYARHGYRHEQVLPQGSGPAHAMSRHSINSSNLSRNMDYTPEQPQSRRTTRGDSRSAWNGYNTIYERQQDAAHPAIATNETYRITPLVLHREFLTQPYPDENVLTFPMHEPYNHSVGVEYGVNYQQAESCEKRYGMENGDAYSEQEQLQENMWQKGSAWQNIGHLPIGNITHDYDNPLERQATDIYQNPFKQILSPPRFEHQTSATHFPETYSPRASNQLPAMPGYGDEVLEESTSVCDEGDPPELAGFWTPRMGY